MRRLEPLMRKIDCDAYRKKLLVLRARLTGEVLHLTDEAFRKGSASSQPNHMAELGSDVFEQDITLQMVQSESDVLEEIDGALDRVASGVYGTCERCEKQIPKARLNAIPYARYCVHCARLAETER